MSVRRLPLRNEGLIPYDYQYNEGNRMLQEWSQHSGETISKHFNIV